MHLRVASFNLESLDDRPGLDPPLDARIRVLRPQLLRLRADVLCLQEVHAQKRGGGPRRLAALDRLLEGTPYARFARAAAGSGKEGELADVHNLIILSRLPITTARGLRHDFVPPLVWRYLTARPSRGRSEQLHFERPLLYAVLELPRGQRLHVLTLHLRAPLAAPVPGRKKAPFVWDGTDGWAEGFLLAALKRSAQALEARLLVDRILDEDPQALVIVAGDLNAELSEVPTRILLAEPGDTGNGALAWRALVPLERGLAADRRYSVVHHGRRVMFDHMLVSRNLLAALCSFEVHSETLEDEVEAEFAVTSATESHHAPLVATFAL